MKCSLRTQTQCVTDVTSVCFETCADCKDFWLGKTLFDFGEVKTILLFSHYVHWPASWRSRVILSVTHCCPELFD